MISRSHSVIEHDEMRVLWWKNESLLVKDLRFVILQLVGDSNAVSQDESVVELCIFK